MQINCDDVITDIKKYDDYFFSTIFTDSPYLLGSKYSIDQKTGKVIFGLNNNKQSEFMNKQWEYDIEEFFKQSFRVLKYGGYLCMFSIDRCTLPFEYYAVNAGLEICQHMYYYFIQNFPKSLNIQKKLIKDLESEIKNQLKLNNIEWEE